VIENKTGVSDRSCWDPHDADSGRGHGMQGWVEIDTRQASRCEPRASLKRCDKDGAVRIRNSSLLRVSSRIGMNRVSACRS
jgi:hypothetical protein